MVNTYLALADGGHAKEANMVALYNRLFAPAADGIVKDDLGSIGVGDYLQRHITRNE